MEAKQKHVVVVGGGFAGLAVAKRLGTEASVRVTLVDRRNHHLFQPLLYQVAMAGLSPAEIAAPIRSILSRHHNTTVLQLGAEGVDFEQNELLCDGHERLSFDYLVLACGAGHSYFGHDEWYQHAPGLKTLGEATEIRRRVLRAFEEAEKSGDRELQKKQLTFVVVGGGPTGVELAGAIGEMSRFTLAKDFRNINPRLSRVILIEAGPRILASFPEDLAGNATRELEKLGVQVWTGSRVTDIDVDGVQVGDERIQAATVLWASGVKASDIGVRCGLETDRGNRIHVKPDLSLDGHPNVFVAGDLAYFEQDGVPLPGVAPVALQQGRHVARNICADLRDKPRSDFAYVDKGQMATIGRSRAVVCSGPMKVTGWLAWVMWLVIHIYYLTGFRNRFFVVLQWAWSYLSYGRGARLIVDRKLTGGDAPKS